MKALDEQARLWCEFARVTLVRIIPEAGTSDLRFVYLDYFGNEREGYVTEEGFIRGTIPLT